MNTKVQASNTVWYDEKDNIAIITIDNPPVNGLGDTVRAGLYQALTLAEQSNKIKGVIIHGAGAKFCGGADIRQFNTPAASALPKSRSVIQFIEHMNKPVVAAIEGFALGGGFELALGCHYRLLHSEARVGLPEVNLGLIPGGGGTQRLPRLIGASAALQLILKGRAVLATEALELGLVDAVVEGNILNAALLFIQEQLLKKTYHPVLAEIKTAEADLDFGQALAAINPKARNQLALKTAVHCVKAATELPFEEGLDEERRCFDELVSRDESKALRHLFFAENAAYKAVSDEKIVPIKRVGIIGAGTMGGGIAMAFANAGYEVLLYEQSPQALEQGLTRIRANYQISADRGKLTATQMTERLERIKPVLAIEEMAEVDLVIEAVFEDMEVKKQVFTQLNAICKAEAILATNTSRLDVNQIAAATTRPQQVIGLHFFSPANVMRLLEIVRGSLTSTSVINSCLAMAKKIGKMPVVVGVCEGFVGNRMLTGYWREAGFLLEEGASPQQIDQALTDFGMAMGPLAMADLAGLDINWATRKRLAPTRPPHLRYSTIADRICELGRFGQKTQAGYYRYEPNSRVPIPDPIVDELIKEAAQSAGITRRQISDEEIVERCMLALINEGFAIVEEKIVNKSSDVDLVYVHGYGFPAWRGGPLFYAQTLGMNHVFKRIQQFEQQHGEHWRSSTLLQRLAAE